MIIFDENGKIIENPDLEKGVINTSERVVKHRYKVTTEEVGHYETIAEYSNGGKDVKWAIDIPEEGRWVSYDENGNVIETELIVPNDAPHELELQDIEMIGIYHLYTEEELAEIARRKAEEEEARRKAEEEAKQAEAEKTALYALLGMEV